MPIVDPFDQTEERIIDPFEQASPPVGVDKPQPGPVSPEAPLSRDDEINKMISGLRPEDLNTAQQGAMAELMKRGRITQAQQEPFFTASFKSGDPKLAGEPGVNPDFIKPQSWKSVMSQAVANTPKSAEQFITDIFAPVLHPVDTAKALGALGVGLKDKLIPGRQDNEQIVDDLVDAMKERYGGYIEFQKTIAEDPVGAISDIASLLIPTSAAAQLTKVPKVAKMAEKIGTVGKAVEPVAAASKIAKAVASKIIPKDAPSSWYQGAAKFSTAIPEAARGRLAQTALDEGIMPTLKGLDKARDKINNFNDRITTLIDAATDTGKKIPVNKLFKEFTELKNVMSSEPITRRKQISRVAKEISSNFKRLGKKDITPKEAQKLKQAIYKETEGFYSSVKNSPAKIDAKHAVARAAKESIEDIFPEIKDLNKKEGALIELKKQLEKSASRISNRDLIGIGVPIKGGAGGAIGGPAGMGAGLILGLFDTPQVKAKLAIVANRLKKQGVVIPNDSMITKILETTHPAIALRQAGKVTKQEDK
jgi:hypothetical protein